MICHRDRTFCAASGTCARRECPRWIDIGQDYNLPVSVAHFEHTDDCPGYEKHPALAALERALTPTL